MENLYLENTLIDIFKTCQGKDNGVIIIIIIIIIISHNNNKEFIFRSFHDEMINCALEQYIE